MNLGDHILKEILKKVARRIRDRADSLKPMKRFARSGIEGWLKVETVAALQGEVKSLQNKGPDVILKGEIPIELKAATNFEAGWVADGALKHDCPCLFLGDGAKHDRIADLLADRGVELVGYEVFSDGETEWVLGIVKP